MTSNMEWKISSEPVDYAEALAFMDARVAGIHEGRERECVWLLEHPPLYTAGTSAKESDLLERRFPVYQSGRGGQYTYHGPGQRIAYVMMDLRRRAKEDPRLRGEGKFLAVPDVKKYVCDLEEWIIRALAGFGIKGERRAGRIGIWVDSLNHHRPQPRRDAACRADDGGAGGDKKIAAIGVRVRHWITLHGISINVDPDLSHFGGIVPCGITDAGVTSMRELLGRDVAMADVDAALCEAWGDVFQSAARETRRACT